MKQLRQSLRTGAVTVVEVPAPRAAYGQVLVDVSASLISAGTERMIKDFASKNLLAKARARPDLLRDVLNKAHREGVLATFDAVRHRLDQPMPLGYSSAGTVIEVGGGVTEFKLGDRVACAGVGAAHAEVIAVPQRLVAPIPMGPHGEVSFEAAAFTTLGAIALHGIRLAEVELGEVVAVIGLGLVGQLTTQLLKASGCTVVGTDLSAERAQLAHESGTDRVATDPEGFARAVQQLTSGRGADAVLITADTPSSQPVELAGRVARDRAAVVAVGAVGLQIPRKLYYEKELSFRVSRSYGPGRYDSTYEEKGNDYPIGYVRWTENRNMRAFTDLLASGRVDVERLISHRFPIGDAPRAYELITSGDPFLGVLIVYPEAGPSRLTRTTAPCNSPAAEAARPAASRSVLAGAAEPTVSLGLLGAGNFALATLLPTVRQIPGVELAIVGTATGLNGQFVAQRFGFRSCTTDDRAVLDNPSVNTVAIATRHHLHARQVLAALEAGKHVFCEKPLALDADELRSIVRAYAAQGQSRVLMVGFNRRFAPLARQVKAFLDTPGDEPLILQYRVNAGSLPPDHWLNDPEQGGGRIVGEVCHFVDFLTFLAGALPVRLQALAFPRTGRLRDEDVLVSLEFANGSLGTIAYAANGDKAFPKERLEVLGGGKVAVLDDFRRVELVRNGRTTRATSRLRQDKGHRGEWEAFVAAVRQGGHRLPIPLDEIVASTLATYRILDALRTGAPTVVDTAGFLASAEA
jgi:predicted dehydrogenase